jgi:hypothetical protein
MVPVLFVPPLQPGVDEVMADTIYTAHPMPY